MNQPDPAPSRLRLGDCWIEGCLRDAHLRVTLKKEGEAVTGLLCDQHALELNEGENQ